MLPPWSSQRTIHVTDENFTNIPRHYSLHVPAEYDHSDPPSALLLYFHMQDESPDDAALTEFEALGDEHGAKTVSLSVQCFSDKDTLTIICQDKVRSNVRTAD
jgi:poly(3-hydroxybutyrate) depolymerase